MTDKAHPKDVADWFTKNPAERTWLIDNKATNNFAASLFASLCKWGSLTEKQMLAIQRNLGAVSVQVHSYRLAESFINARKSGLKWPRITMGDSIISLAGPDSANPEALYVKNDGEYMGKIINGQFHPSFDCGAEHTKKVTALLEDPETSMKQYGIDTGHCCMCNRELTNKDSIAAGIGPICAGRFGFSMGASA